MREKHGFSGKIGFVLAAAGSAVGLGNMWRFPYLAAKYGGGSFLLIYLLLAVTFGFALLLTEIAIGRKTGKSALYAFRDLSEKWWFVGLLASIVPIMIVPYYSVIGGWVVKYAVAYITTDTATISAENYFSNFISNPIEPIVWLAVFIIGTMAVILMGVKKGIENISKVLMPLLVTLSVVICVFVVTRPGAMEGVIYYIKPDISKINANAILAAMGQLFYSMSLAMGIMITYGSYLPREDDIESSVRHIEVFDTAIAFLAGLMIVPSVFAFSNGDESALTAGPTLMFVILPKVFAGMPGGKFVGIAFFVMVLFAALTSSISLMETVVAIISEKTHWDRKKTTIIVTAYSLIMAVPSSLGFGVWGHISIAGMTILDMFDFVSNSLIMPVVALLTCIVVGWVVKPDVIVEEVKLSTPRFKSEKLYRVLIKYVAPILVVLILISSVLNALGVINL